MQTRQDRILSLTEAAAALYGTANPTEEQLNKVRVKLAKGILPRSPKGGWTTTARAVGDYLAAQSLHASQASGAEVPASRGRAENDHRQSPTKAAASAILQAQATQRKREEQSPGERQLSGYYLHLVRDYFLAVALRRRVQQSSHRFQQAVLIGQVVLLAALTGLVFWTIQHAWPGQPAEQAAVQEHIQQQFTDYHVLEWHPTVPAPDDNGSLVRVRFTYRIGSQRPVTTDRRYVVQGNLVRELTLTD